MSNARGGLAAIQNDHWVDENLNLGQYRTEFVCVCGSKWVHDGHDPEQVSGNMMFAQHMADAILAAGYRKPRTITTAEELDALSEGAVIVSDEGGIFEHEGGWWRATGSRDPMASSEICTPATVLHEPEATT